MISLRAVRDATGLVALSAVSAITNAALLASEVVVAVGSSVEGRIAEWCGR